MNATSQGHGHVVPRADGAKARCGGPALCSICQREQATTAEDAQEVAAVRAPVAVATSDADLPDSGDLHGLRAHFWAKHRECEKAAYALASALPIGDERSRVFDLYEIIRTAPREAQS